MKQLPFLPLLKKLGWFVMLWVGGVLAFSVFAYMVKAIMPGD